MNKQTIAVLAMALLTTAGCGTVTRGRSEQVTIKTQPTGAAITTSIGLSCPRAPCTIEVKRNKEFDAIADKPGYKTGRVHVATKFSREGATRLAGNLLLPGGSVGAVVDLATGAGKDHVPNPVVIVLEPRKGSPAKARKPPARKKRVTPVS